MTAAREAAEAEVSGLREEVASVTAAREAAEAQRDAARVSLGEVRAKLTAVVAKLRGSESELESQSLALATCMAACSADSKELEQLRDSAKVKQQQLDDAMQLIEACESEKTEAQIALSAKSTKVSELEHTLSSLQQRLDIAESKLEWNVISLDSAPLSGSISLDSPPIVEIINFITAEEKEQARLMGWLRKAASPIDESSRCLSLKNPSEAVSAGLKLMVCPLLNELAAKKGMSVTVSERSFVPGSELKIEVKHAGASGEGSAQTPASPSRRGSTAGHMVIGGGTSDMEVSLLLGDIEEERGMSQRGRR